MAGGEPVGWVDLYKIYEIIKDAGALGSCARALGITDKDLALFRRSANHPDVGGPDARHARSNERPPSNPMTVGQARALIGNLLKTWLDSLQ